MTGVEFGRLVMLRWRVRRGMLGGSADMSGHMRPGGPFGATVSGETILTRDRSSGMVHRRILVAAGAVLGAEGCNLSAYEVIGSTDDVEPERLCARCFPPPPEGEG